MVKVNAISRYRLPEPDIVYVLVSQGLLADQQTLAVPVKLPEPLTTSWSAVPNVHDPVEKLGTGSFIL
jgi:hypothetical protein